MKQSLVAFAALILFCPGVVLADSQRGDEAYSAGDYQGAYREWRAAADAGDPSAMTAVGTLFDTGYGVNQDFAAALHWYRRAAIAGNLRAMFNVGAMYDNGRGTPADRAEALRWYEAAAMRGNGRAAYAAAVIYRDGDGVARDRAAAIRNFRIAADAGLQAARANLVALGAAAPAPAAIGAPGVPTLGQKAGRPMPPTDMAQVERAVLTRAPLDPALATALSSLLPTLSDQARKGERLAQYNVAYAYEFGHGVRRDPVKSYVYYLRATTSSDPAIQGAARRGAATVGSNLSDAQRATAREMLLDDAN